MTKNNVLMVVLALGLATIYVVWFTDWFRPKTIYIFYTDRNMHHAEPRGNALPNLIFGVRPKARFTDLKVVSVNEFETNKAATPLWHLISDSNSAPVASFYYGQHLEGMRPAIQGVRAEALETNVPYRMFITAGSVKGQRDFVLQ
jgi:hypothetical protein